MKKTLIVVLLAVSLAAPISASAQTVTNEQLLSIIQSLMTQVLALMEQLQKIEADQATQTQTLGAIQQQVTPVVVIPTQPSVSVSFGSPYCDPNSNGDRAIVPFTVNGQDWNYGLVSTSVASNKWHFAKGGYSDGNVNSYGVSDNAGNVSITVDLGKKWADTLATVPVITQTFTQNVLVGKVCQ